MRQEGLRPRLPTGPGLPRQPEGDAGTSSILQSHPGAGARRGGKGPALRSSSCAGPRPEERRQPALQAAVRPSPEGGGTAPAAAPWTPADPRARQSPPGMRPGPRCFGKLLCGSNALLGPGPAESGAGIGRWGARGEEPGDPLTPRCDFRGPIIPGTFGLLCWVNTVACWILCFGTDFRWCDTGDRFLSCTLWVSQITSICSKNKHRLLVRVVKCPVSSGLGTVGDGGRNGAVYTLNSWWHGSVFLCHRIYLQRG